MGLWMSGENDRRLLLLDAEDNVFVVRARICAAESFMIEGSQIVLPVDLPIGHKVARREIARGAKIVKYGAPIGSALEDIGVGAHVHVHNVKSDYTPTYHLEVERAEVENRA